MIPFGSGRYKKNVFSSRSDALNIPNKRFDRIHLRALIIKALSVRVGQRERPADSD